MYYAGQSGIAGAVGNLAGVSFPINESSRTRQIRGIRNLKEGAAGAEKEAAEQMLRRLGGPQLPTVMSPGSSNLPGAVGNMQGVANAGLYGGPQLNQPGNVSLPNGFVNKMVS